MFLVSPRLLRPKRLFVQNHTKPQSHDSDLGITPCKEPPRTIAPVSTLARTEDLPKSTALETLALEPSVEHAKEAAEELQKPTSEARKWDGLRNEVETPLRRRCI